MKDNIKRIGTIVILGVVSIIIVYAFFIANVSVVLKTDRLVCKAPLVTTTEVLYEDIHEMEVMESVDYGDKKNGLNNYKANAGLYENEMFQQYYVYVHLNSNTCIVLHTNHGIVVVNDVDDENTKKMYEELLKRI